MNQADQYYLKAMEGYPYDLEETMKNLDYALSCNPKHAGALYLMGCFYMEQLNDYRLAEEYLLESITLEPNNFKICYQYSILLIETKEFAKARKLIDFIYTIKGADSAMAYRLDSLLHEYDKQFEKAICLLNAAIEEVYNNSFIDVLEEDVTRIRGKIDRNSNYFMNIA